MNPSSIIALGTGVLIIFLIQYFESGSVSMILQPTAFFIVFGGTFCASFLNFPFSTVMKALKSSLNVFTNKNKPNINVVEEITRLAQYARKDGVLSLQAHVSEIEDPFLKRGIQLAIDLNNTQLLYEILEAEVEYEEEQELICSRVFEAFGGYSPTFGIVGAVLGLVQILSDMTQPSVLAKGIATSFVATLYGVGAANLIFLPIAGNLKIKLREKILLKEVVLQGIISIHMNEHPAIIEEKLLAYLRYQNKENFIEDYIGA